MSLNKEEIHTVLDLLLRMNLKQIQKLEELLPEIKKPIQRLGSIDEEFDRIEIGENRMIIQNFIQGNLFSQYEQDPIVIPGLKPKVKEQTKLFLKTSDGQILKVTSICMCSECQKREMPELFLEDMNGEFVDCIKVSDLFTGEYQLSDDYKKLNGKD